MRENATNFYKKLDIKDERFGEVFALTFSNYFPYKTNQTHPK